MQVADVGGVVDSPWHFEDDFCVLDSLGCLRRVVVLA